MFVLNVLKIIIYLKIIHVFLHVPDIMDLKVLLKMKYSFVRVIYLKQKKIKNNNSLITKKKDIDNLNLIFSFLDSN